METEQLIIELEKLIEKNKGITVGVGKVRLDLLAEDCLGAIKRLQDEVNQLRQMTAEPCLASADYESLVKFKEW